MFTATIALLGLLALSRAQDEPTADELLKQSTTAFEAMDFKRAVDLASRAIERDPKLFLGYLLRSMARSNVNDFKGAVSDGTKMIELEPDSSIGYEARAKARYQLNSFEEG